MSDSTTFTRPAMSTHHAVLAASFLLAPALADGQVAWRGCGGTTVVAEARCGELPVWENRSAASGRKIVLRFAMLPALDPRPPADPIVILEGGPGVSNVASARAWSNSPLRARRNLLFIDARGTGGSAPLECDFESENVLPSYLAEFLPIAKVRICRDSLRRRADLTQYVTPNVVDDFDEVRAALGIRQVNLVGTSGGTRQALVWMRRHPSSIRTATLHGPVPLDARIPLTFARDAQDALDGVLGECLADARCAARFPNVKQNAAAVIERLDREPVTVRFTLPGGESQEMRVTRSGYGQVIRYMLYSPSGATAIPLVIDRAAAGDFTPFALRAVNLRIGAGISQGFYLSNTCSEDLPFVTAAEAGAMSAGTFLGDYRYRQQRAACDLWPAATLPRDYLKPVRSDVPVLILVGQRDPVTPTRWGREIARHLRNAKLVEIQGGAHSFAGLVNVGCINEVRAAFIEAAAPGAGSHRCLAGVRRQPFAIPPP